MTEFNDIEKAYPNIQKEYKEYKKILESKETESFEERLTNQIDEVNK